MASAEASRPHHQDQLPVWVHQPGPDHTVDDCADKVPTTLSSKRPQREATRQLLAAPAQRCAESHARLPPLLVEPRVTHVSSADRKGWQWSEVDECYQK